MPEMIGAIVHEDLIVRVEPYNGDQWEDHTIHILSPSWMRGVVPSDEMRPVFTLSEWETLELIGLLVRALQAKP